MGCIRFPSAVKGKISNINRFVVLSKWFPSTDDKFCIGIQVYSIK